MIRVGGDPVWQAGQRSGSAEQMFHFVAGGRRLSDGSVVVGVAGATEVRRYGPDGSHQWSRGRSGQGPGEFHALELLRGCTDDDTVTVYDRRQAQVTEFSADGDELGRWRVSADLGLPFHFVCGGDGRLIFHPSGSFPAEPGIIRWRVPVAWADQEGSLRVLREDVAGPERVLTDDSYADRQWGHQPVFAGSAEGVWIGTGDAYALDLVGWDGGLRRRLEWEGPVRDVTPEHVDALYERLAALSGDDPDAQNRFRNEEWPDWRKELPETLPAYTRLLLTAEGELWVGLWAGQWFWRRPTDPGRTWLVFDRERRITREVRVPGDMSLLDAGADWVLVVRRDELGVERIAIYDMM